MAFVKILNRKIFPAEYLALRSQKHMCFKKFFKAKWVALRPLELFQTFFQ